MAQFSSAFHRNSLLRIKQYTAATLFPSSFTFLKDGRGHTLSEIIPGPYDPDAPAAPHAVIIAVGVVSETKMFLTPAGNHNPGGQYPKPFAEAKYIFMINKPDDPTFAPDYAVSINALKKLQTSISKSGKNKWLIVQDGSEEAIRFSSPVFVRIGKDTTASESVDIATWPVHVHLHEELDKMVQDYTVRDFPVFDVNHKRVEPGHVEAKMRGALVECSFRILHYNFGSEIAQIVILRPKPLQPASPYKKSANKPYRPAPMSAAEIHAQEQRSVNFFTPPISMPIAGPSTLPAPPQVIDNVQTATVQAETNKRTASEEPEGSKAKHAKTNESADSDDSE
ncbi:hypothetical protein GGX14DRAFT_387692 [Mycena pura]|uniref:Uncharacterized protein n=1 Tax=Mycena pura TaxID=153505 RepID=A0AAD7E187_9AGAR|nr:hypothetical protein GGX14DRAFT_387692 [Mycena pura]